MPPVATAETTLRDFAVLGGILRSELDFPELQVVQSERPDWVLRVAATDVPAVPQTWVGERKVGQEFYRLWSTPEGFRLEYSHAGTFDILHGGQAITWYPAPGAPAELGRAIVLGTAVSLGLELQGYLCLHGSAISINGKAIAFLGAKHHGKSTLATALIAAGGDLISDDLLAVSAGPPAMVRAGVASVRLWEDSALHLDVASVCDGVIRGIKMTAHGFAGRVMTAWNAPLDSIYLLSPVLEPSAVPCWRTPVRGAAAVVGLAHQTKLPDSLVGLQGSAAQLRLAGLVSSAVPVWTLSIVRDFSVLPGVVEQIVAWHTAPPTSSAFTR